MAIIDVCPSIVSVCEEFAAARIGMSEALYRSRGEAFISKMINDIVTGGIAEYAVYNYILSKGLECTKPDMSIHQLGEKSFSADLKSGDRLIHVKSQTLESAVKYSPSWIFQQEDRAITLPSEKGYAVFCVVDGLRVYIKAAIYIIDVLEAEAVSRPKVGKYAMSKKAIYLNDLLAKNIDIRRF